MATYKQKLLDPRWKQRVKDFKRDYKTNPNNPCECEFACEGCGAVNGIDVHHTKYITGLEPWEYEDQYLVPLCRLCHSLFHENKKKFNNTLTHNKLYYSYEASEILDIVTVLCGLESHNLTSAKEAVKSIMSNQKSF